MRINLPLSPQIYLKMDTDRIHGAPYPTSRIQKGLILFNEDQELCEEAVGFGLPILKRGLQTIFPGEVEFLPIDDYSIVLPNLKTIFSGGVEAVPIDEDGSPGTRARFILNLEEKLSRLGSGTVNNRLLYAGKNRLAALIRRLPLSRRLLTYSSNLLRSTLDWQTTYEPGDFTMQISMIYRVDPEAGKIEVELEAQDFEGSGVTEVIVMNEQGARSFDHYHDSKGLQLRGDEIGCWDRVQAAVATFTDHKHQVSFSLPQIEGAELYRGRELVGKRLAWSGFGYSFPPSQNPFRYTITINRST